MRKSLALVALILAGCAPKTESPEATATPATSAQNAGGVAPMASGAAGGLTPVSGGESVDGAGMGGVGDVAKGMARRAAGNPTAPSVPPDNEGGQ